MLCRSSLECSQNKRFLQHPRANNEVHTLFYHLWDVIKIAADKIKKMLLSLTGYGTILVVFNYLLGLCQQ